VKKAPQHFCCEAAEQRSIFSFAHFLVVVMTTAISKYYFSEKFFREVILLQA